MHVYLLNIVLFDFSSLCPVNAVMDHSRGGVVPPEFQDCPWGALNPYYTGGRDSLWQCAEPGRAFEILPGDLQPGCAFCFGCKKVQRVAVHDLNNCFLESLSRQEQQKVKKLKQKKKLQQVVRKATKKCLPEKHGSTIVASTSGHVWTVPKALLSSWFERSNDHYMYG